MSINDIVRMKMSQVMKISQEMKMSEQIKMSQVMKMSQRDGPRKPRKIVSS